VVWIKRGRGLVWESEPKKKGEHLSRGGTSQREGGRPGGIKRALEENESGFQNGPKDQSGGGECKRGG